MSDGHKKCRVLWNKRNLQQCVVGMNPRECLQLGCSQGSQKKTLTALLQKSGVLLTQFNQSEKVSDAEILSIMREPGSIFYSNLTSSGTSVSDSMKPLLAALFTFFNMRNQPQFARKFILSDYRTSGYLHLDAAAVSALELFSMNYFNGNKWF